MLELLWTSPEHLREDDANRTGSPKGDVYSFSIILQEIIQRSGPWGNCSEDTAGYLHTINHIKSKKLSNGCSFAYLFKFL